MNGQRHYIDPSNYEDPEEALRTFAKELEKKWISLEKIIGGGTRSNYRDLDIVIHPKKQCLFCSFSCRKDFSAQLFKRFDNAFHRINHYPVKTNRSIYWIAIYVQSLVSLAIWHAPSS